MDDKEKKELIDKILNVELEPKLARVSATVFMNKATKEEARFFLTYLEHHNPNLRKIARSITAQMGISEAADVLIQEFANMVGVNMCIPDIDMKDASFYTNLIEILETIFTLAKTTQIKNDMFYSRIEEVFKKTKHEDLRFTLMKLLTVTVNRFDSYMKMFDELTDKERRGLYHGYTFSKEPRRLELYKRGLSDERNFDYVVANMLSFPEGRVQLSQELLSLSSYNKQLVLKKLMDGKYPEFLEVLTKILNEKNKILVEMATDVLKNNISTPESVKPFIEMIESSYAADGIMGALEIVSSCVKKNPEDIYIRGLQEQPSNKNKDIIAEFIIEQLKDKEKLRATDDLTEKIFPPILALFDNYVKDKEDLHVTIFKLIPLLKYSNATNLKNLKKKLLTYRKDHETRMSAPFKNNMGEFMVKLGQLISRFDEAENRMKSFLILFDIDPLKIDHARMMKFKEQLQEVESIEDQHKLRLVEFLLKMVEVPRVDWKIKTIALELLGEYGRLSDIPRLTLANEKETSLAVKVNAQKAIKRIEERNAGQVENVLIIEPLFYIQKKLSEFFKTQTYKVFILNEIDRFSEISNAPFKFFVVTEAVLTNDEFTRQLFDYLDENFDSTLIIITVNPELLDQFKDIPNIKFLKKPFNDEQLLETVKSS